MTKDDAASLVKATFAEYVTLHTRKGIGPEAAAKRLGISRPRYYQLKQGQTTMQLHTFLTVLDEVTKMRETTAKTSEA